MRMTERVAPTELTFRSTTFVRGVVATCIAAELTFVVLDYHVNYGGLTDLGTLRRLTNIAREDSLASWFGTAQTLLIGLTLWLIFLVTRQQTTDRLRRIGWLILASFFSFMAVDDGALLHERAGTVFSKLNSSDPSDGTSIGLGGRLEQLFPSYEWQIVALPIFVVAGVFLLFFLWRELEQRKARIVVVAALACFTLAVGLDFVEGLESDHPWNLYTNISAAFDFGDYTEFRFGHSPYDTLRHFSKSIEELGAADPEAIVAEWERAKREVRRRATYWTAVARALSISLIPTSFLLFCVLRREIRLSPVFLIGMCPGSRGKVELA